jgi:hypothetical protein
MAPLTPSGSTRSGSDQVLLGCSERRSSSPLGWIRSSAIAPPGRLPSPRQAPAYPMTRTGPSSSASAREGASTAANAAVTMAACAGGGRRARGRSPPGQGWSSMCASGCASDNGSPLAATLRTTRSTTAPAMATTAPAMTTRAPAGNAGARLAIQVFGEDPRSCAGPAPQAQRLSGKTGSTSRPKV